MAHTPPAETSAPPAPATKKDRTHWLYIAVIVAVIAGVGVGKAEMGLLVRLLR